MNEEIQPMRTTLAELRAEAERLERAFKDACLAAGFADYWDAYRADARGEAWPASLAQLHDASIRALHAFYERRDGPNGFLGARGL